MSTLDIGSAASNRATTSGATFTYIDLANPANITGFITSVELWFNTNATGVKIGTFSGSAPNFTSRNVATIGNVTAGSKQTFTGLHIYVMAGDFMGIYSATGDLEFDSSGGTNVYYKAGDQFGAGSQSFTLAAGYAMSVFSTGVPPQRGVMNII